MDAFRTFRSGALAAKAARLACNARDAPSDSGIQRSHGHGKYRFERLSRDDYYRLLAGRTCLASEPSRRSRVRDPERNARDPDRPIGLALQILVEASPIFGCRASSLD